MIDLNAFIQGLNKEFKVLDKNRDWENSQLRIIRERTQAKLLILKEKEQAQLRVIKAREKAGGLKDD